MLARVKRLLVTLGLLAAPEATALAQVSPGPVRLVGTLSCDRPIASPIRGRPCIAYVAALVGQASAEEVRVSALVRVPDDETAPA